MHVATLVFCFFSRAASKDGSDFIVSVSMVSVHVLAWLLVDGSKIFSISKASCDFKDFSTKICFRTFWATLILWTSPHFNITLSISPSIYLSFNPCIYFSTSLSIFLISIPHVFFYLSLDISIHLFLHLSIIWSLYLI